MTAAVKRTQAEFHAELVARFGPDPMNWAFTCPSCGDIATGAEAKAALQQAAADGHPHLRRDGTPRMASDVLGQQCIGRLTGALDPARWKGWTTRRGKAVPEWKQRGCDWAAGGLFPGPEFVVLPDGTEVPCFPIAPAPHGGGDPVSTDQASEAREAADAEPPVQPAPATEDPHAIADGAPRLAAMLDEETPDV